MKIGDKSLEGPELIRETSEKTPLIQQRLKKVFSRQKSYTDPKRRDIQFDVRDYVFLKVSPMKGVMRFGKRGKFTLRYTDWTYLQTSVTYIQYFTYLCSENTYHTLHMYYQCKRVQ